MIMYSVHILCLKTPSQPQIEKNKAKERKNEKSTLRYIFLLNCS